MKKSFDCDEFMRGIRREARERRYLKDRYRDWRNLFATEGEEFLRCAYGVFLRREIDATGLNTYLPLLERKMGKAYIICSLMLSPERTGKNLFFKGISRVARSGFRFFFQNGKNNKERPFEE